MESGTLPNWRASSNTSRHWHCHRSYLAAHPGFIDLRCCACLYDDTGPIWCAAIIGLPPNTPGDAIRMQPHRREIEQRRQRYPAVRPALNRRIAPVIILISQDNMRDIPFGVFNDLTHGIGGDLA